MIYQSSTSVPIMPFCERCGTQLHPKAAFCRNCGTQTSGSDTPLKTPSSSGASENACPACGTAISKMDKYCPRCGRPSPNPSVWPTSATPTINGGLANRKKAGFAIRALAYIVDQVIIFLITILAITLWAGQFPYVEGDSVGTSIALFFVMSLSWWWIWYPVDFIYFVIQEGGFGRTLGKRVFGLRVHKTSGATPIGLSAIGRWFVREIGIYFLLIGVIWIAADKDKQGWHDKAASTFVLTEE